MRLNSSTGEWRGKALSPACERANLLITRHIDGELAEGDARDLRMHLATCSECRRAMDVQTSQSQELAEKLKSLWAANDCDARKKKDFPALNSWMNVLQVLPKIAACAAFMAGTLYLASTAFAPSPSKEEQPAVVNSRVDAKKEETRPELKPSSPAVSSTAPARAESLANPDTPCGFAEVSTFDEDFETALAPNTEESAPAQIAPIEKFVALENPVVVSAPESLPIASEHAEQTLAALSDPAPLKPLPGVSLDYSLVTAFGAREEGRVTLLGDVLNGKACVRLETESGDVLEAAQDDIDTVFDAPHAALARRLLRECEAPINRKRLEQAIAKFGASGQ